MSAKLEQIELKTPEKVNGLETKKIEMSAPQVKHFRQLAGLSDVEAEFKLVELLCNIPPHELDEFSFTNYLSIQKRLEGFLLSGGMKPLKKPRL